MNLPFTTAQFLSVFEQYNQAVWPFQIVLNLLALCAIVLCFTRNRHANRIIAGILALYWLWMGIAYHLTFFASINPAARVFGVLNILQGLLFLYLGVFNSRLSFRYRADGYGIAGALFLLYGLIVYPALGAVLGHAYPQAPTFGLPCPTTIVTFGLILWTQGKISTTVLIIPFLWSLIGFSAALTMGIYEDIGLLVAGVLGTALLLIRDRKRRAVYRPAGADFMYTEVHHQRHLRSSPGVLIPAGVVTLAAVFLAYAAIDDITTDDAPSFTAEYAVLILCAVWGLVLTAGLFLSRKQLAGIVSLVLLLAAVGAQRAIAPGSLAVLQPEHIAMALSLVWFLGLSIVILILGFRRLG
jgi:Family of unknown function (DUF6064)